MKARLSAAVCELKGNRTAVPMDKIRRNAPEFNGILRCGGSLTGRSLPFGTDPRMTGNNQSDLRLCQSRVKGGQFRRVEAIFIREPLMSRGTDEAVAEKKRSEETGVEERFFHDVKSRKMFSFCL